MSANKAKRRGHYAPSYLATKAKSPNYYLLAKVDSFHSFYGQLRLKGESFCFLLDQSSLEEYPELATLSGVLLCLDQPLCLINSIWIPLPSTD